MGVAFHTTRPADASDENLVEAGTPFTASTRYVRVNTGRDLWLDVSALDESTRETLSSWLVRAGGVVTLERKTGLLVVGTVTSERSLEADTRPAGDVLSDANARGADWGAAGHWAFLNGGSEALEARDADATAYGTGQTKPGAWYNHYHQKSDGTVQTHTSRHDRSGTPAPEIDEAGLRALIKECLDINRIRDALGDDIEMFRAGLGARFASGHALGDAGFDWVVDELWSYLQTGAGRDGAIDIGRLQAIARALDADTASSAETNTSFAGRPFALGDTGETLARGDGAFGRATMLSLMHLVGSIHETVMKPPSLSLVPAGAFEDRDRFLVDRSGSMVPKWGGVSAAVNDSMGWGPDGLANRQHGSFDHDDMTIGGVAAVDLGTALERAYRLLHPDDTRKDRVAFAALFGLQQQYIFHKDGLDGRQLRLQIGDDAPGSARKRRAYGAKGESGLKGFLMVLTHPEMLPADDPLRAQLEQGTGTPGEQHTRLNAVVDEPEQSLEYLAVVQALGRELGVDLRFVATATTSVGGQRATQLQLIDIEDISIDRDGEATIRFTQAGIEQTRTVEVDGHRGGMAGGTFDGAELKLHHRHKLVGITH